MARPVHEIENEIQALSTSDKAKLLRALVSDLDKEVDEDVERVWTEEARRRHREMKDGQVEADSSEEVFERARASLNG